MDCKEGENKVNDAEHMARMDLENLELMTVEDNQEEKDHCEDLSCIAKAETWW